MSSTSPILDLIRDYQKRVDEAMGLLRAKIGGETHPLRAWRSRLIPGAGTLGDSARIRYRFHGIGCYVIWRSRSVDFDFCPDGGHDGFDAWRLNLLDQQTRPRRFPNLAAIEAELDGLARDGRIRKQDPSHLYRLIDGVTDASSASVPPT